MQQSVTFLHDSVFGWHNTPVLASHQPGPGGVRVKRLLKLSKAEAS